MSEKEILRVLELAESGDLPDRIVDDSVVPLSIVQELHSSGYLDALLAHTLASGCILEPRINVAGREYLKQLRREQSEASLKGKTKKFGVRVLDWVGGIIAGLIIAWLSKVFGSQ